MTTTRPDASLHATTRPKNSFRPTEEVVEEMKRIMSEKVGIVRRPKELTKIIHSASLAGLSSCPDPYPMVVFTDPGQDLDDEMALIMARYLEATKLVRVLAVVATLAPAHARARLARGTLDLLGLHHVLLLVQRRRILGLRQRLGHLPPHLPLRRRLSQPLKYHHRAAHPPSHLHRGNP